MTDAVAPSTDSATAWLAGYTPAAWAAYNQVVQTQSTNQPSNDNGANVTRVGQIGTAEVTEAGALGTAESTLASAAGTTETGLVGELATNGDSLAGEEATADEGFNTALGANLSQFLTGMAKADVDWAKNAGGPIEDYQQSLGNDEVTAAKAIANAPKKFPDILSSYSLLPGEVLFLLVGWWHHVRALEVSITVTFTNFLFDNTYHWDQPHIVRR